MQFAGFDPMATVTELIAKAKARPGQLTFSSSGIGNRLHLAGELFNFMAGTQVTPPEIVNRLNAEVTKILRTPEFSAKMRATRRGKSDDTGAVRGVGAIRIGDVQARDRTGEGSADRLSLRWLAHIRARRNELSCRLGRHWMTVRLKDSFYVRRCE